MEWINRATLVKIEPKGDLPKFNKAKDSMLVKNEKFKKESKKRGVYVVNRVDPEPLPTEEKEEPNTYPSETEKLPETTSARSKKQTCFRHVTISGHVRTSLDRKPIHKIESKFTSNSNNLAPQAASKPTKPQRNIIEENIRQIKTMQFRSSILRETQRNAKESKKSVGLKRNTSPSLTSDVTNVLPASQQVNWSNTFPIDSKSTTCTNRFKKHGHNYKVEKIDQKYDVNSLVKNIDDPANGKDKTVYNFLIDLLDTVCDDNLKTETENVDIHIIEEDVARKLFKRKFNDFRQRQIYQRKFQDDNPFQPKLSIVDSYKQKTIIPQKSRECPKKNRLNKPEVQVREKHKTISRKQNILALLKRQLSSNYYSHEPESMYQALQNIAKNNREYKRNVNFSNAKTSANACRFRRRKVISATKRSPKHKERPKTNTPLSLSNGNFVSQLLGEESIHSLQNYSED